MNLPSFQFYHTNNGPCPYLPTGVWENLSFQASRLSAETYVNLLNQGFRRSGCSIYHPICEGCQQCIPIRVNVKKFEPKKSQIRAWKKNQDLRVEHRPLKYTRENFALYQKYQTQWHHTEYAPDEWEYRSFLLESPVHTEMIYYYLQEKLIGIGWIDVLPDLISSVYFVFDPDYASRRLGVFSLLYELGFCEQQGYSWLYLGYWVEHSRKMKYKAEYSPSELLIHQQWIPFAEYFAF